MSMKKFIISIAALAMAFTASAESEMTFIKCGKKAKTSFAIFYRILDIMNFNRWDRITGWVVFAIAALTYLLTMEPSSSLWDCAEFIATSYKLEVGHPPGAPLYMLLARIATMFAPSSYYVPHMVNGLNCIVSAFCILFLFWSITHLARRIFSATGRTFGDKEKIAALGAGVVGALAYTFTDTFWFSAVEGEVYALSSMFTALVVWLMLKWEEQADEPHSARWIILIAYLTGRAHTSPETTLWRMLLPKSWYSIKTFNGSNINKVAA